MIVMTDIARECMMCVVVVGAEFELSVAFLIFAYADWPETYAPCTVEGLSTEVCSPAKARHTLPEEAN